MRKAIFIFLVWTLISFNNYSISEYLQSNTDSQSQSKVNNISAIDDFKHQHIKKSLDSLADSLAKQLRYTNYGIAVYSLNTNQFVYKKNAELFLKPASVTKLITTFAVYSQVGDTFRIPTEIYSTDENLKDNIINGDLIIKGYGDCFIKLSDLDELIRQLKSLGIKKITGNVIADGTFFDNNNNRFHYSGDADEVEPTALITALSLENNRLKVIVNSNVPGNKPKIQIIPSSPNIRVNSNLVIGNPPKKTKKNQKSVKPRIYSTLDKDGNQIVNLSGNIARKNTLYFEEFNKNPILSFAGNFYERLKDNGIVVGGKPTALHKKHDKIAIGQMPIAFINRGINDLITLMNKNSDNYIAENLFKFYGAYAHKDTLNTNSAKLFMDSLLKHHKIYNEQFKINDGSGLSRRNRISAEILVNILKIISQEKYFNSFLSSLAIAGVDGTLAKRLKGTTAEMNVFGKTGTHRDVSALAGVAKNIDGEIFLFTCFSNGGDIGTYKMMENSVCIEITKVAN